MLSVEESAVAWLHLGRKAGWIPNNPRAALAHDAPGAGSGAGSGARAGSEAERAGSAASAATPARSGEGKP